MIQEKPAVFQFSTEALPEQERLAVWREVIGRTVAKTDFEPLPGTRFSQTATLRSMPGLTIVTGTGNGYRAERTAALLAGSSDDFYLLVHAEGESQVSQLGREISFGSGEALLLSGTDVASKLVWEPLRYIVIGVPREALRARLKNPEAALMKQIPGSNEALRVLVSYLSAVNRGDPPLIGAGAGPLLPPLFATHVYDLMAMAIAATRDEGPEAEGLGLRAARLQAIKADIARNPGRLGLSVASVAVRHGVSPRYVHMLFAAEGVTFSEFVLNQRLLHAHRMLNEPHLGSRTIGSIAFEAGFSDLSHFNRAFRLRFSATPSDVRQAAGRGAGEKE